MASGSIFQFAGLSSGFNTDTILEKMLEIENAPINTFQARQAQATQEQSAWRSMNTRLLGLQTSLEKLGNGDVFQTRTATSSKPEVATASVQPGQDLGTLTFSVEALAQQHQQISQGFATSDAPLGSGTIQLKVGSASFAPIALQSSQGTLEGVRDAINNAKQGVRASILDAGESAGNQRYRLMLNSETSGSLGQMQVTFSLSGNAPAMTDLVAAQDAHIKLGQGASTVDVYSSTNSVTGALAGVTLNLKSASPGNAVQVQMNRDTSDLRGSVQGVLDQFNSLADAFSSNFRYNKETGETGVLFGDSNLLGLQSQLYDRLTGSREVGAGLNSLTSIGITLNDKGKLSVTDNAAFEKALSRPDDLKKLFNDPQFGIVTEVKQLIGQATNVVDGTITLQDKRLTAQYEDLEQSIQRTKDKASRTEQRLRAVFLAMETAMSKIKSQSSALTASLSSLPTTSSIKSSSGG